MTGLSRCLKFEANIFDKSKCQHCFKPKELHSAAALECNKATRKISKCSYLFVAPDSFDFSSPLDRTKRWQRRFFVLYDDGELTYSVDENVHTVPQGTIDMNVCADVCDAEPFTGHPNSIAVKSPSGEFTYMKGTTKDETTRWLDILAMYPRSNKSKHKRAPTFHGTTLPPDPQMNGERGLYVAVTSSKAPYPSQSPASAPPYIRSVSDFNLESSSSSAPAAQYRGIRALKRKDDHNQKEALKKSHSLHEIDSDHTDSAGSKSIGDYVMGANYPRSRSMDAPPPRDTTLHQRRLTEPFALDDPPATQASNARDRIRRKLQGTAAKRSSSVPATARSRSSDTQVLNGQHKNETDELKMAKSMDVVQSSIPDDLTYIKKGWLVQRGLSDKDWTKHWFVLSGTSLVCFADSAAEDTGTPQQTIDLSAGCSVCSDDTSRNYGFKLKVSNEEYLLSAMTAGIRQNWIKALEKCVQQSSASQSQREPRRSRRYTSMPGLDNGPTDSGDEKTLYASSRRSRMKEGREDSRGSRDRHTTTCTWPFQSDPDQAPSQPPPSSSEPYVPNAADFLEDGEQQIQLTAQQEKELDHVEHNIRRIHRKSISEFVQQHKVPHQERFESKETTSSDDHSGWSSPAATSPRLRLSSIGRKTSEPRSPGHYRAPSAKIKDRTRAKSPRPRSPPPEKELMMSQPPDLITSSASAKADAWRQGHAAEVFCFDLDNRSSSEGEDSLRRSKERTISAASMMSEQSTSTSAHPLQLKIKELEVQISNAEQKVQSQKQDLLTKDSKLTACLADLSRAESACRESLQEAKRAKDHEQQLQGKMEKLEKLVQQKELAITHLENDLGLSEEKLAQVEVDLEEKTENLADVEERLRSSLGQEEELNQLKAKVAELLTALEHAKSEQKGATERDELLAQLETLEQHLQKAQKQSNMADSLSSNMADLLREKDETISQLEEKLIENDSRVDAIGEELSSEVEQHQRLKQTCHDQQQRWEQLQSQIEKQKNLEKVEANVQALSKEKDTLEATVQALQEQLRQAQHTVSEKDQDYEGLLSSLSRTNSQREHYRKKHDKVCKELEATKRRIHDLEEELSLKMDGTDEEKALRLTSDDTQQQLQENLQQKEREAEEMKELLKERMAQLKDAEAAQSRAEDQLKKVSDESRKKGNLRESIVEKDAELSRLDSQVNALQHEMRNMQTASETQAQRLEAKVMELAQELDTTEKKNRRLERKLRSGEDEKQETSTSAIMIADYEAKLRDCKARIACLQENEMELMVAKEGKGQATPVARISDLSAQNEDQQTTLDECLASLKEVLSDIESSRDKDVELKVRSLVQKLSTPQTQISESCQLRSYAECLALEALIVGQIASSASRSSIACCGLDSLLLQISHAQHKMLQLGRLVSHAEASSASDTEPMDTYAEILADRFVKASELQTRISDATVSVLPVKTLNLHLIGLSESTNLLSALNLKMVESSPSLSLPDRAMLQTQLLSQLGRLQANLQSSEPAAIQQQVAAMRKQLLLQEEQSADRVHAYLQEKTVQLAKLMVLSSTLDVREAKAWRRETLQAELLHAAKCCMEKYIAELLQDSAMDAEQVLSVIRQCISTDTDALIQEVMQAADQLASEEMELDLGDLSMFESSEADEAQRAQRLERQRSKCTVLLADALSRKAVIRGHLHCIEQIADTLPSTSAQDDDTLSQELSRDAQIKAQLALCLMSGNSDSTDLQKIASEVALDDQMLASHFSQYLSPGLLREAVAQAQLTVTVHRLRLEHLDKVEAAKKLLEEKYTAEKEELLKEISEMQHLVDSGSDLTEQKEEVSRLELEHKLRSHEQEVQSLKDGYEIRIKSLQQDLEAASHNAEKNLASERQAHNTRLQSAQEELSTLKAQMEALQEEQEQESTHWRRRVSALDQEVNVWRERQRNSAEEVVVKERELRRARTSVSAREDVEPGLLSPRDGPGTDPFVMNSKIQQLEMQLQNLQGDYEQELAVQRSAHQREIARTKEEVQQLLEAGESKNMQWDEGVIRKKFLKEMEHMKEIYDKGFSSMERSHQRVLMQMRKAHKQELESLRQEKEQLLAEETRATQAALDAMRKAQEEELRRERDKFLGIIAKTYSQTELEALQTQHEEDMELLQWEMKQLMEQYSLRCLENAALHQRMEHQTSALQQSRSHSHTLKDKNEELVARLKHEIQKLKRCVEQPELAADSNDSPQVASLKLAMLVKQGEISQLQSELDRLQLQVEEMSCELEERSQLQSMSEEEHKAHQRHLEAEVKELQTELNSFHASSSTIFEEEDGIAAPLGSSTPLVNIPNRTKKASSWRQKNPERAMSNPGIPVTKRISMPSLPSIPAVRISDEKSSQRNDPSDPTGDAPAPPASSPPPLSPCHAKSASVEIVQHI